MDTIKKNVTDQVYDKLMRMLLKGVYKPGDKLPSENELTDQFGASRNTIRSALTRMNALGLVETRRGEGTFFKSVGTSMYLQEFLPAILTAENDLMGLMSLRRGLEVSAARLAAINATEADILSLEEYFDNLAGHEIDNHEFAEANTEFHRKIAAATGNELIVEMLKMIGWIITSRMADFLTYTPDGVDCTYYHYMVYRCIRQHKPEEAAFMMDRHMQLLIDKVRDYTEYCKTNKSRHENEFTDSLVVSYTFKEDGLHVRKNPYYNESDGSQGL